MNTMSAPTEGLEYSGYQVRKFILKRNGSRGKLHIRELTFVCT